ncbi:type I restriction enzyme, S subunit [Gammaproteobacteria bacterium]
MNKWKTETLGSIAASFKGAIISGPFGSNISSKYFTTTGVPVIRGNNLSLDIGVKFKDEDFVFVSEDKANELRAWAQKNDLIFTAAGTIGQVAILTGRERFGRYIISNKQLRVTLDEGKAEPLFAYYWFASPVISETIVNSDTGSTIPLINLTVLRALPILLPPLPEQRAIAAVLSSLDDKIDLLHRQNKTLEAMAETLFRQWFVVEADEGWEEGKISDLFILQRGYDLPIQDRIEGNIPIVSSSGITGTHSEYKVKGPGIVTGRSGLIGGVYYIRDDFWPLNTSLYIKTFLAGTPLYSYFILSTLDLHGYNAGSSVPTLNRNHVHAQETAIPPRILMLKFESVAEKLFSKITWNQKQIRTLETLRDTLLPKLMSGEVRIKCQ